jgi:hypothetical protein
VANQASLAGARWSEQREQPAAAVEPTRELAQVGIAADEGVALDRRLWRTSRNGRHRSLSRQRGRPCRCRQAARSCRVAGAELEDLDRLSMPFSR